MPNTLHACERVPLVALVGDAVRREWTRPIRFSV
jgi:hypothetical protein